MVSSLEREQDPPTFWNDLCLENTVYIPVEPNEGPASPHLIDNWLTPDERALKQREIIRLEEIRHRQSVPSGTSSSRVSASIVPPTTSSPISTTTSLS